MIIKDFQFKQDKICCISDIHIGVHQNSQMWLDICDEWAQWLTNDLKAKNIQDIVISGDLFHYRDEVAVNTMHYITDFLNYFKEFNIIVLVGNHDAFYKDRSDVNSLHILTGWKNIAIVESQCHKLQHGDTTIGFVPWGIEPDDIPECDIMFGHFEIESFNLNQHMVCKSGIKSKDLLDKSQLILTGHFHTRDEREYKKGKIIYLGNPYQMDFGDCNQIKGYYILDITDKKTTFYENTTSPLHQKITLSDLVHHGDIDQDIIDRIKNNIVRFVVDKNIAPDEIEQLLRLLSSYKPLTLTTDYNINFDRFGLEEHEADLSGISIESAIEEFVNLLDIESKQQIIDYTIGLYKKCK